MAGNEWGRITPGPVINRLRLDYFESSGGVSHTFSRLSLSFRPARGIERDVAEGCPNGAEFERPPAMYTTSQCGYLPKPGFTTPNRVKS